jgi:hypothetical protein
LARPAKPACRCDRRRQLRQRRRCDDERVQEMRDRRPEEDRSAELRPERTEGRSLNGRRSGEALRAYSSRSLENDALTTRPELYCGFVK